MRVVAGLAAVAHQQFLALEIEHWHQLLEPGGVLLDLKGVIPRELQPIRL